MAEPYPATSKADFWMREAATKGATLEAARAEISRLRAQVAMEEEGGEAAAKEIEDYAAMVGKRDAEIARLRAVADALLLFHGGGGWTAEQHDEWVRLTGRSDVTTKALCDTARDALGKS